MTELDEQPIPPGGFTVRRSLTYTIRIDEERAALIASALNRFCQTHDGQDLSWAAAHALAVRLAVGR